MPKRKVKVNPTIVVQGSFRLPLDFTESDGTKVSAILKMIGQGLAVTPYSSKPKLIRVIPDLSKPLLAFARDRLDLQTSEGLSWIVIYDKSVGWNGSANARNNEAVTGKDANGVEVSKPASVVIQLGEVLGHYTKEGESRKSSLEQFLAYQINLPKAPAFVQVLPVKDGFTSELMTATSEWAVYGQGRRVLAQFDGASGSESVKAERVANTMDMMP